MGKSLGVRFLTTRFLQESCESGSPGPPFWDILGSATPALRHDTGSRFIKDCIKGVLLRCLFPAAGAQFFFGDFGRTSAWAMVG